MTERSEAAKNIFDTHAHYTDRRFDTDRETLLGALPEQGVAFVLCCGSNLNDSKKALRLAEQYEHIYAACGVHPHEAKQGIEDLQALLEHPKCAAVGEMGLDYHYDFSPCDVQQDMFRAQLTLAQKFGLPVVIHDREAHEDTLKILQEFKPRGVMHCFSGSIDFSREVLALGLHLSFGGAVTFHNARRALQVVEQMPLDRLLLETDAPYMAPVPYRGQRCDSRHIALVAEKIAQLRGIGTQALIDLCTNNARRLFQI